MHLKSLTTLILVSFLIIVSLPVVISSNSVSNKTIYVDDDNTEGPWYGTIEHPYQYIQDAVDNASAGDTIFVYNGTYPGNIAIRISIELIGENRDTTIIDRYDQGGGLDIFSDNCIIKGFTILNTHIGIHIKSSNNIISNNLIFNNFDGIHIAGGINNTISNNIISNSGRSNILIRYSLRTNIYRNYLMNCRGSSSFALDIYMYSHSTLISQNSFFDNDRDAIFHSSYFCRWKGNYWDGPCILPKLIEGYHWIGPFIGIPTINIDWRPAQEPYNIPIPEVS